MIKQIKLKKKKVIVKFKRKDGTILKVRGIKLIEQRKKYLKRINKVFKENYQKVLKEEGGGGNDGS